MTRTGLRKMALGCFAAFAVFLASRANVAEGPLAHRTDLNATTRERLAPLLAPPADFSLAQPFEAMPGGGATVRRRSDSNAFSLPAENLEPAQRGDFAVGNGVFRKLWTPAPSSTTASDGLGPLFNSRACQRCHLKDGRGHPPPEGRYWERGEDAVSFVLGLSVPAPQGVPHYPQTLSERVVPHPYFGAQLHDLASPGVAREGRPIVTYTEKFIELDDGTRVSLRDPTYTIADHAIPLGDTLMMSPRVANPMIGLGLLEAVHEADIRKRADPDDADGDGISGRVHTVRNVLEDTSHIGRFGWKATQPTVRQQSAFAFATDMGLSTGMVPTPHGDCMEPQTDCLAQPTGEAGSTGSLPGAPPQEREVPDALLDLVAFYAANLGVPQRVNVDDPTVLRGKALFHEARCAACHTPAYLTRDDDTVPAEHRRQLIWPFTDLLLHDMGAGLADNRPQGEASGREWRTTPLWGIGLTQQVSGHTQFLHDGRARNVMEAILWHDGEARLSRDAFAAMEKADRAALLAYVNSL